MSKSQIIADAEHVFPIKPAMTIGMHTARKHNQNAYIAGAEANQLTWKKLDVDNLPEEEVITDGVPSMEYIPN